MAMHLQKEKARVAMLSVISNTMLMAVKLLVGSLIGSVSVISEAIHSGIDLGAALIALFCVRKSSLPPDQNHPFGHGKTESISGVIEALLIFVAAAWILVEAVNKLLKPGPLDAPFWGVAVMIVSVCANLEISKRLFQVGRKTDSLALLADAWHLRTDVYTSAGVMVSLLAIWMGTRWAPFLNLQWIDPAAAMIVAFMIIKAAYNLTLQSARDLLDGRLPDREEAWIQRFITRQLEGTGTFHRLRTRKSGAFRFIDFHVRMDSGLSIEAAHRINEALSEGIQAKFPGADVTVHFDSCMRDGTRPSHRSI